MPSSFPFLLFSHDSPSPFPSIAIQRFFFALSSSSCNSRLSTLFPLPCLPSSHHYLTLPFAHNISSIYLLVVFHLPSSLTAFVPPSSFTHVLRFTAKRLTFASLSFPTCQSQRRNCYITSSGSHFNVLCPAIL